MKDPSGLEIKAWITSPNGGQTFGIDYLWSSLDKFEEPESRLLKHVLVNCCDTTSRIYFMHVDNNTDSHLDFV